MPSHEIDRKTQCFHLKGHRVKQEAEEPTCAVQTGNSLPCSYSLLRGRADSKGSRSEQAKQRWVSVGADREGKQQGQVAQAIIVNGGGVSPAEKAVSWSSLLPVFASGHESLTTVNYFYVLITCSD